MKHNEQSIRLYIQRISNILMLNGGFLDNPGLYSGEMGVALFFFHYARFTQNDLYLNYGYYLIKIIQNRIHLETPINYKEGLTGIGSAIEYLVQAGYIKDDTDELLEDFDNRIFSVQKIPKLSIEDINSILYYAIWRISGSRSKRKIILNNLLQPVINIMDECFSNHTSTCFMIDYLKKVVENEYNNSLIDKDPSIIPAWDRLFLMKNPNVFISYWFPRFHEIMIKNDIFSLSTLELGFHCGLAGMGMTLLTELDNQMGISWISLIQNDLTQMNNESLPF